jgi:hypothetical protein
MVSHDMVVYMYVHARDVEISFRNMVHAFICKIGSDSAILDVIDSAR